nr:methyltransferase 13 [Bixa orellana]
MVVAEKENSSLLHEIISSFNHSSLVCNRDQAIGLCEAFEKENQIRKEYLDGADIIYSLEDLQLGAKGDLTKLNPGHRIQLTLGGHGCSKYSYKAILLDAKEDSGPFSYYCGVFIVPKTRAHEWLFSSEGGQWQVVESSKAARLIMVLLDTSHSSADMEVIQKDLSPLVKQLAPADTNNEAQIPFMMASDGIKQRDIVYQVTSSLTGPIVVEDVVYENVGLDISRLFPSRDLTFRRLIFKRMEGLVQSEALLTRDGSSDKSAGETERKKAGSSSKSKRRGAQKRDNGSTGQVKVYHGYLASSYHTGIISGFTLISSYLESVASAGNEVKAIIIGLGAGLLPMFLHGCVPFLKTEVVELDPTMLNLAKDYFGFIQTEHLKVHIADGIHFVQECATSSAAEKLSVCENENVSKVMSLSSNGSCTSSHAASRGKRSIDILVIDVDSSESSSGMICPAPDFVEESFLLTVKGALSVQGLFVINLVSRSSAIKDMVVSRMKMVFSHLFCLQVEEDVNTVLFGLCSDSCIKEDCIPQAAVQLEKLLKFKHPEISQSIRDLAKKIRCLK